MIPIDIIGIGQARSDVTAHQLNLIENCDVLVGGQRQLAIFEPIQKQVIVVKGKLDPIIEEIRDKAQVSKVAVLASGDPLFYGIGSTLCRHFKRTDLNIFPNVSSVCAAFSAIKEPWHDACVISLHGKDKQDFAFSCLHGKSKVAFLTDPDMDPGYIANGLLNEGLITVQFCVLENLGSPEQQIRWFDNLKTVKTTPFSHPNIVILKQTVSNKESVSRETHIGMDESLFRHTKGLITKSEVRAVSLSKLKLIKKDHVLWDIGSGSGSVSVEASLLLPWGHVYAIEKHPERIADIVHNIHNFKCSNVKVVNTNFPEECEELKTPDRIFIGGGGQNLEMVLDRACEKLKPCGVIVINTVLLQTLETAIRILERHAFKPETIQIQVSRSKDMPFGQRLESLNPVWIISGSKPLKESRT